VVFSGDFPQDELSEIIEHRKCDADHPEVRPRALESAALAAFYCVTREANVSCSMRELIKWSRRKFIFPSTATWAATGYSLFAPSIAPSVSGGNASSLPADQLSNLFRKAFDAGVVLPKLTEPVSVMQGPSSVKFQEGSLEVVSRQGFDLQRSPVFKDGVQPDSFLRHLCRLAFAVQNREPVLLIGPTAFKSLLVRTFCKIANQELITVYLSPSVEANSILGEIHPYSYSALLELIPKSAIAIMDRYELLSKKQVNQSVMLFFRSKLPEIILKITSEISEKQLQEQARRAAEAQSKEPAGPGSPGDVSAAVPVIDDPIELADEPEQVTVIEIGSDPFDFPSDDPFGAVSNFSQDNLSQFPLEQEDGVIQDSVSQLETATSRVRMTLEFTYGASDKKYSINVLTPATALEIVQAVSVEIKQSADSFFVLLDFAVVLEGTFEIYSDSSLVPVLFPTAALAKNVLFRAVLSQDYEKSDSDRTSWIARAGEVYEVLGLLEGYEDWSETRLFGDDQIRILPTQTLIRLPEQLPVFLTFATAAGITGVTNSADAALSDSANANATEVQLELVRLLCATYDFKSEADDEVNVSVGTIYEQMSPIDNEWIYVRPYGKDYYGIAPYNCFAPVLVQATRDCVLSSSQDSSMHPVSAGDILELVEYPNKTALLMKDGLTRVGVVGTLPDDCFQKYPLAEQILSSFSIENISPANSEPQLALDAETVILLDDNVSELKTELESFLGEKSDAALQSMLDKLEDVVNRCKLGDQGSFFFISTICSCDFGVISGVPQFLFKDGPVTQAVRFGKPLFLEDFDLPSQAITGILVVYIIRLKNQK
jgi:hypothetical protein